MIANFDAALAAVLDHEGGFVNHPADPGGMTNLGCTKKVWEEWCGRESNEKEMRELTKQDVSPIYKQKYWDKIQGDYLPAGVDYVVFDCAINSGPGRAAKFLQQVVGATQDGAIGPGTLGAVEAIPAAEIVVRYSAVRLGFLQGLATWETFGKGWERRVEEVKHSALKMVRYG